MTPMEIHDAICALLDLDDKIIEHKASVDRNWLDPNHVAYNEDYVFAYQQTLFNLRRAAANRILERAVE